MIPSAEEPFLVLSRKEPSLLSEVVFLENAPTSDAQNVASRSRFLSTEHISCCGSALGLLAMRWNHAESDEFFCLLRSLCREEEAIKLATRSHTERYILRVSYHIEICVDEFGRGWRESALCWS